MIPFAAVTEWLGLLPNLMSGAAGSIETWNRIKEALAASGIAADTAQLDWAINDAVARKAREDAILAGEDQ